MWLLKRIWDDLDFKIVDEKNGIAENIFRALGEACLLLFVLIVAVFALSLPFVIGVPFQWEFLPLAVFLVPVWITLVPLGLWLVALQIKGLCGAYCTIRDQIAKEKAGIKRQSQSATCGIFSAENRFPLPVWETEENSASPAERAPSSQGTENDAGQYRQIRRSRVRIRLQRHREQANRRFRNAGRMRQNPRSR